VRISRFNSGAGVAAALLRIGNSSSRNLTHAPNYFDPGLDLTGENFQP
jgi:hypothetical protein